MTDTDALLPCPFCGSGESRRTMNASFSGVEAIDQDGIAWVQCGTCTCEGPTHVTSAAAIAAWNRRPSPATSTARPDMDGQQAAFEARLVSDEAVDRAKAAYFNTKSRCGTSEPMRAAILAAIAAAKVTA